jgi:2-dehydropantoate 2-reductase
MADPQLAIIGAGAVGSLIAISVASNERTAYWVEHDSQRRDQVEHLTLLLEGTRFPVETSRLVLCASVAELPPDLAWVIICVKAQHVDGVLTALPTDCAARVLVIANGLHEHSEHVGLLYGGACLTGGELHVTPASELVTGRLAGEAGASAGLGNTLGASWLAVAQSPDIAVQMWHKLAMNCVINPLTALADCVNGELPLADDSPWFASLVEETHAVAQAVLGERWPYSVPELMAAVRQLALATATNSSSMREDLRRGRGTEISRLNLAVAALGHRYGVDCPTHVEVAHMIFLLTNKSAL